MQETQLPSINGGLKRVLARIAGVALFVFAWFLVISLLTYERTDPSWNVAADHTPANWGGLPGAWISDMLLQFIGLASIAVIVMTLGWSWRLVRAQRLRRPFLRIAALMLGLPALAALFACIEAPDFWAPDEGLGGAIGRVVYEHTYSTLTGPGYVLTFFAVSMLMLWAASGLTRVEWATLWQLCLRFGIAMASAFSFLRPARVESMVYGLNAEEKPRWWKRMLQRRSHSDEVAEEYEPEEEVMEQTFEDEPEQEEETTRGSKKSRRSRQPSLALRRAPKTRTGSFEFPSLTLLSQPGKSRKSAANEASLAQNAKLLESVLLEFGVQGSIVKVHPGPVVTLYELEPSPGTKSARVIGLADDIARSMSAVSARIAVIPGRNAIGIELPNSQRETVHLRELLEDESFTGTENRLPIALGKDIGGNPIVADLARMPHLLVAGTTGSGKSVAVNTMILSLMYHLSPEQCKFILIDPKMLELSMYDDIPHLLTPVVTEPGKAVVALKWTVKEMENRYRLMSNLGVRNIDGYNKRVREALAKKETLHRTVQTGFDPETGKPIYEEVPLDMTPLPYIVVVVDEMADLMILAGKDIETSIQRLAQMARAAGIHIIMATQRPSVDVITGVIKANFPTRISFQVTSRIDSRTILGEQGAEQLLGQGDMLYMAGGGRIMRVHGPFVSDREVGAVVDHLKTQGEPVYIESVTQEEDSEEGLFGGGDEGGEDQVMYEQAVSIVCRDRKASTSYIQRHLKIGYNRAARLMDRMEQEGIVGAANHVGKREVLIRSMAELKH